MNYEESGRLVLWTWCSVEAEWAWRYNSTAGTRPLPMGRDAGRGDSAKDRLYLCTQCLLVHLFVSGDSKPSVDRNINNFLSEYAYSLSCFKNEIHHVDFFFL